MAEESIPRRRWYQFTIADLALGTTLVAAGIGLLLATIGNHIPLDVESSGGLIAYIGLFYASGAIIGAGVFSPFRLKTVGLILGFLGIFPVISLFRFGP
jgi:hypothetical protein